MDGNPPLDTSYPGDDATPGQILDLARAYADSAETLFKTAAKQRPSAKAPARFLAIHGIELFVESYLRSRGIPNEAIRARHHCLWHKDFARDLQLDTRTCKHLHDLFVNREHLVSRYSPDQFSILSAQSRILATLKAIRDNSDRIPFSL